MKSVQPCQISPTNLTCSKSTDFPGADVSFALPARGVTDPNTLNTPGTTRVQAPAIPGLSEEVTAVPSPCSTWTFPYTAKGSFPRPSTYIRAPSTWQHLHMQVKCSYLFSVYCFAAYIRRRKINGKNNSLLTRVSSAPPLPTEGAV